MKSKVIIFLLVLSSLIPVVATKAATTNNLNGKILLQVESKGEAWYVNPKDGKRYYMANGDQAFQIMKTLGVGMNNKDVDKMKKDAAYRKKFIGKILLQVESKGEAYYISSDGRYNYLKDGASAYQVMRKLGLGISNANLNKISEYKNKIQNSKIVSSSNVNCGKDMICFMDKIKNCTPSYVEETKTVKIMGTFNQTNKQTLSLLGSDSSKKCIFTSHVDDVIDISYVDEAKNYFKEEIKKSGENLTDEEIQEALKVPTSTVESVRSTIGMTTKCLLTSDYLTSVLTKWATGIYSSTDLNGSDCTIIDKNGKSIPML